MPGHYGGSSSSSSSSSSNSGPAGGASAGGNYGGNSSGGISSNNMSNTGGTNVNTNSNDNDNRLNYLSGAYQDINLTEAQKEAYANQKKEAAYAISPMSKPSNMAIGIGLNLLIPGSGFLFGDYKESTAMGYNMNNPLKSLTGKFSNAKDWVGDKFGGLLNESDLNRFTPESGGDNERKIMNTLAPLAPYAVSETIPDVSQANKWYNSIGNNSNAVFNFAQAYTDAKTKVTKNLSNHGPLAKLAVSNSPYYDWLKTNKIDKGIL